MTGPDEIDTLINVDPMRLIPERIVPGRTDRAETADHMARYAFAATCARGRTLDLGSGIGYGSAILASAASVDLVVAFDVSHAALLFGRRSYGEMDASITHVSGNAIALPFATDSFDSVVCLEAIEHVPNAEAVLREIARVLRPGRGSLVISTPNKWATSPLSSRPINPHHVQEWYPRRFKAFVSKYFMIHDVLGQGWHPFTVELRAIRMKMRTHLRDVLRRLHLLTIMRTLLRAKMAVAPGSQPVPTPSGMPSPDEIAAAWPVSWRSTRKQGLPVTVAITAAARRGLALNE